MIADQQDLIDQDSHNDHAHQKQTFFVVDPACRMIYKTSSQTEEDLKIKIRIKMIFQKDFVCRLSQSTPMIKEEKHDDAYCRKIK